MVPAPVPRDDGRSRSVGRRLRIGQARRRRRRRFGDRQARLRRDEDPRTAHPGGQCRADRCRRSLGPRGGADRGDRLVRWRTVRLVAVGAAAARRRASGGAEPRRRHPGRPDRRAATRPDRGDGRRTRRGHLPPADRASRQPSRRPRATRSSNRGGIRPPPSGRPSFATTTCRSSSPTSKRSSPR